MFDAIFPPSLNCNFCKAGIKYMHASVFYLQCNPSLSRKTWSAERSGFEGNKSKRMVCLGR